jgi:leader peptidase (prepilin peptidase)/N-methyltransferase
MDIVIAVVAGIGGLLIGGIINILADDLPARRNPRPPHYPDGTPRPISAWFGIMAFLTGQRTSPRPPEDIGATLPEVGETDLPETAEADLLEVAATTLTEEVNRPKEPPRRLSWRYLLVEIVLVLSYIGMALGLRDEKNLPFWFVYVAVLMLITVIDIEHRLILFVVILPACLFALLVALISPEQDKSFMTYVFGGLAGFTLFFVMFLGGIVFSSATNTGEVAFGFGDVMLATLCGLILGWQSFIFASLITVFVGAAGAMLYLMGRAMMRQRYRWFTPLPYGPYIVIGTVIVLLFRDEVKNVIWSGYF